MSSWCQTSKESNSHTSSSSSHLHLSFIDALCLVTLQCLCCLCHDRGCITQCVCVFVLLKLLCVFPDLFQSSAGEWWRQNTPDSPPIIIFNNRHSVIQRTVQTEILHTHTHTAWIFFIGFICSVSDLWWWLYPSVGEERVTFFHQDGFKDGQIQNTQNRLPGIINSVKKKDLMSNIWVDV